ncbi:MAG: FtsX-like permease family protein [Candidatus Eremiobacteraeota bacterium]|nr:FtsX-like permease family protein [Candidatus Eremiobacteraeota bacterium]
MSSLFRALVLGHLRSNRLRALVTLVAVGLGVAISLAIDLANATAVASFATSVNVVANHVNLQVLGVGRGFDERALLRAQAVDGVTYASPTIEESVVVGARPGDPFSGEILRVLGVDLLRPLPHDEAAGTASLGEFVAAGNGPDPYTLIARRGAIVSHRVAERNHLKVGGTLEALAGDRTVRFNVAAILPASVPGLDSSVLFVDIATAQEIFGKVGLLDRIDLVVEGRPLGAVRNAVAAVLPHGARAIEPAVRTNEIKRMLRSFQLNLAALSYIAMLVGMYLIYNTVAISVVQRRPEVGTLRALGATRGQIFRAFIAEGATFGVFGSLLGLVLGSVLAQLAVGAVSRTVDTMYVATHADRVFYDPLVLLKAFAVGTVLATLSALFPALEAASTAPAITMRAQGFERQRKRPGMGLALVGIALFLAAYLLTFIPAVDGIPLAGYAAGLLIIFGGSLCVPLAIAAVASAARALTARLSPAGLIGATNLGASIRRNSVAVASLMVAIAMMVSVAILIGSFRTTVVAWADETLRADLFVRPLGLQDASYDARFSPAVATKIRKLPGVVAVDTFRAISIPYRGSITTLGAADFRTIADRNKLRFLGNVDTRALAHTLPGTDNVVISEPFATRFHTSVGDTVDVDTPSGLAPLKVVAIYNDYSSDAGVVIADSRTFARLFHDDSVNSLAIYAAPDADLPALRTRVIRSVLPLRIDVQTTRELRRLVIEIFNRTFAITYALYVISITIAVLGVVSTLFALVLERRREIGLLRYLGLTAGDVRSMVFYEAAYIGGLGGLAGVAVGIALALLLIFVINRQAFGWLIELHMPWDFLAEAIGLVIVAALIAGIYPAAVAARIRTAEAVRSE